MESGSSQGFDMIGVIKFGTWSRGVFLSHSKGEVLMAIGETTPLLGESAP